VGRCVYRGWIRALFAAGLSTVVVIAPPHARAADAPEVVKASFSGDELDLEFDAPMLTWSSTTQAAGIEIEPAIDCSWSWQSDTVLQCAPYNPDQPPPKATRFTVRIGGGLWSQDGREIAPVVLHADSQRPQIDLTIVGWDSGVPIIDLHANMPVTDASMRGALHVSLEDGTPVEASLRELGDDETTIYGDRALSRRLILPSLPADRILSVSIAPGLVSTEGVLTGEGSEAPLRARVNESFRIRRIACATQRAAADTPVGAVFDIQCLAGENIEIEFSKTPDAASFEWFKSGLRKPLEYRGERHMYGGSYGRGRQIEEAPAAGIGLAVAEAQSSARLEIPATLRATDGSTLTQAVTLSARSGDFPLSVSLHPYRYVSAPGLDIPDIIEIVNLPKIRIAQDEIGGGGVESQSDERRLPARNRKYHEAPPSASRDVRRNGGFVRGTLDAAGPSTYEVAYAPFNLTAAQAGNQALIWTTEWNEARPKAGVAIEILKTSSTKQLETLATGVTDADGVAIVDIPRVDGEVRRESLIVRASQSGQRAVMPLTGEVVNERTGLGGRSFWHNPSEGESSLFGVTDRPLYRPGETVHYRLWLRKRDANHFRSPATNTAMPLRLESEWGDGSIRTWTEKVDEFGSVAGTIELPSQIYDDRYCIHLDERASSNRSACFRVAGFHVNDMWTEVKADRQVAHEGDTVVLDANVGYYSGGPAAGARVETQSLLTPMRVEDAYPAFAEFRFVDPYENTYGAGGESFSPPKRELTLAGADGRARTTVLLNRRSPDTGPRPIPFGQIEFTASASNTGGMYATSAPARVRFSRYPRFVGLKISPWLLRIDDAPEIEAIVVGEDGTPMPGTAVEVFVEEIKSDTSPGRASATPAEKPLARCTFKAGGAPAPCAFHAPHSGSYRFRAVSENAAETSIDRFVVGGATENQTVADARVVLTNVTDESAKASSANLLLQQPFRHAKALFAIEHGRVFKHWLQDVDQPEVRIDVPLDPEWSPGVTVSATVLDASGDMLKPESASTLPLQIASVDVSIAAKPRATAIEISPHGTQRKPGDDVALTLRNVSAERRQVTVAVVDDALLAMVSDYATDADPHGPNWLGLLGQWSVPEWYGFGSWARRVADRSSMPAGLFVDEGNDRLETITVTGSNIAAADVFMRGSAHDPSLRAPARNSGAQRATLRSRFLETALWQPDRMLASGAEETLHFKLPDNLTRWRVLVWSNDENDAFDLAESTITASLPVELRAELPTRIYVGDQSAVSVSARNHGGAARDVAVSLAATGAGVDQHTQRTATIAPNAEATFALTAAPIAAGALDVSATARSKNESDGIAAGVEVASTVAREHEAQSGWLEGEGVTIKLPALPAGATNARLTVRANRNAVALAETWIKSLRDYPHRCWEQILSRAIGAAVARELGLDKTLWPDADATVRDALNTAAAFQDVTGAFRYFVGSIGDTAWPRSPLLTAYTLRGFALLRELGYEIPEKVEQRARHALALHLPAPIDGVMIDEQAATAAALATRSELSAAMINTLWVNRHAMSWYGRAELARALSARADTADLAREAIAELESAGEVRGLQRVIVDNRDRAAIMGSNARDQCAMLDALSTMPGVAADEQAKRMFLRGLADLYAGGAATFDTQANAQCLMAILHAMPPPREQAPVHVDVVIGDTRGAIELASSGPSAEWSHALGGAPATLTLKSNDSDHLLSYVADMSYDIDQRASRPGAVGLTLQRRYAVMRDHAWKDVPATGIRQGEWVRVTLMVGAKAVRRFVAVSDPVIGGLRPADLNLAGVSDVELRALATSGSPWFSARQVDDRTARFYANTLPPGAQEICYYARATHTGAFFAPPATAELMYGEASSARTEPFKLKIGSTANNGER